MNYSINARLFNAVLAAQAVGDTRSYLNGFFINADRQELVATNGHMLCIAPLDLAFSSACSLSSMETSSVQADIPVHEADVKGWIFGGIAKPLLKSAEWVVIDTKTQRLGISGGRYKGPQYVALEPVKGLYPDYRRIKADNDGKGQGALVRGLNPEYIWRCFQWAGIKKGEAQAKFLFHPSANEKVGIRPVGRACTEIRGLHISLMPCRV